MEVQVCTCKVLNRAHLWATDIWDAVRCHSSYQGDEVVSHLSGIDRLKAKPFGKWDDGKASEATKARQHEIMELRGSHDRPREPRLFNERLCLELDLIVCQGDTINAHNRDVEEMRRITLPGTLDQPVCRFDIHLPIGRCTMHNRINPSHGPVKILSWNQVALYDLHPVGDCRSCLTTEYAHAVSCRQQSGDHLPSQHACSPGDYY